MRITVKHLEAKVETINAMLGYESPAWNVVGSVHLYQAFSAYGVHRVVNTSGGVDSIMPEMGTAREARQFLSGMISALRIARESESAR